MVALIAGVILRRNLGVEISRFSAQKQPDTINDCFTLLQNNRLLELSYLNLFDLVNYALVGLMFLALYAVLRRANRSYMGGEPGITIVPNLLITGILTIIVSLALILWAAAFVQRKKGGLVMILLSVILLLVGGGVGPPIIGILAGVAWLGIGVPLTWWGKHLSVSLRRILATLWPWIFGVAVINGVFLVIGSLILVYFFDLNNPDLFTNSFFFTVVFLLLLNFTGRAYDIQKSAPGVAV